LRLSLRLSRARQQHFEIVHRDDLAGRKRRHHTLFEIGEADFAVHRAIDHEGSAHPVLAQAGDEGDRASFFTDEAKQRGEFIDNPRVAQSASKAEPAQHDIAVSCGCSC